MLGFSCCGTTLKSLSRAAAKSAGAKLRQLGLTGTHSDWASRAEICERCPKRVVACGISYCGNPFLKQPVRDIVTDGCGCPTHAKAKDPAEHCPITQQLEAATKHGQSCDCKWCIAAAKTH